MCTVTVVPVGDGFRLSCNRDEKLERPRARPPEIHTLKGRRVVFPIDPVGPGTWIGVNDLGLAAALLNRTSQSELGHDRQARRSRGLIIPMLLACTSLAEALEVCAALQPDDYDAFRLVIVQHATVAVATSDRLALSIASESLSRPLMYTSSSLSDALVEGPRRRLFDRLFGAGERSWLGAQGRFHAHRWRTRPDISVLMERRDAKTICHTVIDVSASHKALRYREIGAHREFAVEAA